MLAHRGLSDYSSFFSPIVWSVAYNIKFFELTVVVNCCYINITEM